ncbi:Dabb family protein [Streptomyces sp. NBC_01622]|uniref:Dabb family protein n=1 Tax=Streptomyces sp. NBC_01622 TaxID=2975903 RepID=UPI003866315B|nr:Dabb family protein [Streptomyces sp. NBC_01622]
MIRNLVFFKLNDGLTRESPEVVEGFELVRNLERDIPEIRQWEVGWHAFDETPVSYDFALNSLFDDTAAFQRYFNHPAHLAAIAHWMEYATWVVVDMHV